MSKRKADSNSVAVNVEGDILPYTPDEVDRIVRDALDKGRVLFAAFEMPNGDVALQVFGPPSLRTLNILKQTYEGLRGALRQ